MYPLAEPDASSDTNQSINDLFATEQLAGHESPSTTISNGIAAAEHSVRLARLEAEEWKLYAQSLRAALERQRLMTVPSSDSDLSLYGDLVASRQANRGAAEQQEDVEAYRRQIVSQRERIHRREASLRDLLKKYQKAKKKLEDIYADLNNTTEDLDRQKVKTEESEMLLLESRREIDRLRTVLEEQEAKTARAKSHRPRGEPAHMERQQSGAATIEELRKSLAMERVTSAQLQSALASKNQETLRLKANFKATLEEHKHRQIGIGQVLHKLQGTQHN